MSSEKKLFLLDGYALIYRAYYAYIKNPLTNSKGENVSAIYGYINTLTDLIRRENPTHIALALDPPGATLIRVNEHDFYKANRPPMPEDIRSSIPIIRKVTEGFKIPILMVEGYEADDVIGTVAKRAEKAGFKVYMVTPDKDFGQLVSENIFMYKPSRSGKPVEIMGVPEILAKWGIQNVDQVIDILGLMGDASDNIPGIRGVGEKTAVKLLDEFGSIENLLQNTDKLKGKLKEKVEDGKGDAIISKMLATIVLSVPIECDLDEFILEEPDKEALNKLFVELEFRTLGKRLFGESYSVNQSAPESSSEGKAKAKKEIQTGQLDLFGASLPANQMNADLVGQNEEKGKNIENTKHNYILVNTDKEIEDLIKKMMKEKLVCFDTETTGLDANNCELVGMSFSFKTKEGFYVPIDVDQVKAKERLELFRPFFENDKIGKIGQNLKYDMLVLKWYGMEINGDIHDTMIQHYLIEPDMRHNLDFLSETYLGYSPVSIESLIGKKGKKQGSMRDVELEKITEYASEDADLALQLFEQFDPALKKNGFEKLYKDVEAPLVRVLADLEFAGVKIDTEFLEKYSIELGTDIDFAKKQIFEKAGEEFNMDSPKQLGPILFEKMGIPYKGKKTKTGQYSTNEETLRKLSEKHTIVKEILEYRGMTKLRSTYVDALPKMVNPKSGLIHSSLNQAVAATGRLSSSNPNLQNIPIRTEKGKEVRKAFIPRSKDHILLAADYSQIELRIIASLSQDKNMLTAFNDGLDIHTATAAKVYGMKLDEVDSTMRRYAKMVNFGIVYGISAFGLAQRLGIKRGEAKVLIEAYFEEYSGIQKYMTESVERARETGYAETILGRRRYLKDINSRNHVVRSFAERNAINAPVQGSAADLIKVAMIDVHNEMKKREMKSKMILQVHDELLFDTIKSEKEELSAILEDKMVNAIKMDVPIEIEIGTGNNWLEAH